MLVTKRNGSKEEYDLQKIRKVVEWACEKENANPIRLESSLDTILTDGVKTSDIHNNLIYHAKSFISLEEPSWRKVAGKLLMQSIWKNAFLKREDIEYGTAEGYISFLEMMIRENKYIDIFELATKKKIKEIFNEVGFDIQRDFLYDYAGAQQLEKKYLMPLELPQELFLTISIIAGLEIEKNIGIKLYKQFYTAFSTLKLSAATPILLNLRRPKGNLSSCFTLVMDDSLDSIYDNLKRAAFISKNGGGVGIDVSSIRARGSSIQGYYGRSNGVTPWIKLINDSSVSCNQLGARKGAITVSNSTWHYDIEEFIEIQTEEGDLRNKSFDIFPQVIACDKFMRAVEKKENWYVFCPHEVKEIYNIDLPNLWGEKLDEALTFLKAHADNLKMVKVLNAHSLFVRIMQIQIETGLPYIFFIDNANKVNPNKLDGMIKNANLCVESFSNTIADELIHVCNLAAVNLSRTTTLEEVMAIAKLAVYFVDALINITKVPTELGKKHNDKYRTIGVGVLGLADYLAFHRKNYNTGKEIIAELFETFGYSCTEASIELCEKGLKPFEAYENSLWAQGKLIGKDISWFEKNSKYPNKWIQLKERLLKSGIRNSQVTALMPTTSTSLLQGCTASIFPPYSIFSRDVSSNRAPIMPYYIEDRIYYYQSNLSFPQKDLVNIMTKLIQPYIDTGISFELAFDLNNPDVTAPYIKECIFDLWRNGGKTLYYIRTKAVTEADCAMCSS